MNESMFFVGEEGLATEKRRQEILKKDREESSIVSSFPFRVPVSGTYRDVVVLSLTPVSFYKHTFPINKFGKQVFEMCPCTMHSTGECFLCSKENSRSFTCGLMVFEITPWTDKDGRVHEDGIIKPMFRLTTEMDLIEREYSSLGVEKKDCVTKVLRVYRDGDQRQTRYSFRIIQDAIFTTAQSERLSRFLKKYPEPHEYIKEWASKKLEAIKLTMLGNREDVVREVHTQSRPSTTANPSSEDADYVGAFPPF